MTDAKQTNISLWDSSSGTCVPNQAVAGTVLVDGSIRKVTCESTEFLLTEQVGRGAASTVWKCHEVCDPSRPLAAKVIDVRNLGFRQNFERERQKLRREVSILGTLHHPSIVNLVAVVETAEEIFVIMEFVPEGELFYKILKLGALSEPQAQYVTMQICHALYYVHAKGVIHRDLKLENILVQSEPAPGYFQVKVADFGLSKFIGSKFSEARSFVGTPQYWAPEVIKASVTNVSYGPAADLWSLGCLLYVLIGGAYPFGDREGPIESQITKAKFHFHYPRFNFVSEDVKNLIRGLLTVDCHKRLTLEKVLNHPWMKQNLPENAPSLPIMNALISADANVNWTTGPLLSHIWDDNGFGQRSLSPPRIRSLEDFAIARMPARGTPPTDAARLIFDPVELVDLQISIAKRFQLAYVAFRNDPVASVGLLNTLQEFRQLQNQSSIVVAKFESTCALVIELFPDIAEAVACGEPGLAVGLLDDMQKWCAEMKVETVSMQSRATEFSSNFAHLVTSVRLAKKGFDRRLATTAAQFAAVGGSVTLALPQTLQVQAIEDRRRVSNSLDDECEDFESDGEGGDVVFMESSDERMLQTPPTSQLPSIEEDLERIEGRPTQFTKAFDQLRGSLVERLEVFSDWHLVDSKGKFAFDTSDANDLAGQLLDFLFLSPQCFDVAQKSPPDDSSPAGTAAQLRGAEAALVRGFESSKLLISALEEIRRVDEILSMFAAFWSNFELTLQRLVRLRDHTERLLKVSSSNEKFRKTLDTRLGSYEEFWRELCKLCRQYRQELQTKLPIILDVIQQIHTTAEQVDTLTAISPCFS